MARTWSWYLGQNEDITPATAVAPPGKVPDQARERVVKSLPTEVIGAFIAAMRLSQLTLPFGRSEPHRLLGRTSEDPRMSGKWPVRPRHLLIPIAALLWAQGTISTAMSSGPPGSGEGAQDRPSAAQQAPAVGAYADEGPVDVPDGMWYDATSGLVRGDVQGVDAARAAEAKGIEVEEARIRLIAQERMSEILEDAHRLYPELVAVRWVDGQATAQFKDQAPAGALELLESSGAEVRAEVVQYSTNELNGLLTDLEGFLEEMGVKDFAVGLDPAGQRLIASANTSSTGDGPDISKQALEAALPSHLADANVDIQVLDGPITQAATTYGGTDARKGTTFWCTNAFTVSNGSTDGIVSDSHCGTSVNSYRDWITGITHTMSFIQGHIGFYGDLAWWSTSGNEVDDFYFNELGSRRDVTGVRTVVSQGDELFWFGRSSMNDWLDFVEFPIVNTSGPDKLACNNSHHSVGGDSGGPVYLSGTAIGLIWGYIYIDGAWRDCFTRAHYVDDALGVGIKN